MSTESSFFPEKDRLLIKADRLPRQSLYTLSGGQGLMIKVGFFGGMNKRSVGHVEAPILRREKGQAVDYSLENNRKVITG